MHEDIIPSQAARLLYRTIGEALFAYYRHLAICSVVAVGLQMQGKAKSSVVQLQADLSSCRLLSFITVCTAWHRGMRRKMSKAHRIYACILEVNAASSDRTASYLQHGGAPRRALELALYCTMSQR